jgi:hypothetical protein
VARARADLQLATERDAAAKLAADSARADELAAEYEREHDACSRSAIRERLAPLFEKLLAASRAIDWAIEESEEIVSEHNAHAMQADRIGEELQILATDTGQKHHVDLVATPYGLREHHRLRAHISHGDKRLSDVMALFGEYLRDARSEDGREYGHNDTAIEQDLMVNMMRANWPATAYERQAFESARSYL